MITHIEVLDNCGNKHVQAGKILRVVRETPAFYWVSSHDAIEFKVSKRTHRIIGTKSHFFRAHNQPIVNL